MANCYCLNPVCPQPENPPDRALCAACGSALLIRGRYRAFKRIGQGGFGATFLAQDEDLPSRPWRVIKQLRPLENSPQMAQLSQDLFYREAKVLESLGQHSQIPTLYAYFEENEKFYLVQEFVQGSTLSQELHRNGVMSEEQAIQTLKEVLLLLGYVHSQHTVHRDIKPANLIRRKNDQRLVLIDFGAVKELNPGKEYEPEQTSIRSVGFSPPEQMSGQAVLPASDLYALGATCLNLMTMESPARFLVSGRWDWSERLQLSPMFERVLLKMLQPDIRHRFATATEVLMALAGDDSISQPIILPQGYGMANESMVSLISPDWGAKPAQGSALSRSLSPLNLSRSRLQPTPPRVLSMAGENLRDRSFVGQNLAGCNLRGADIRGVDLSRANLKGSDLRGVIFNTPKPVWLRILSWILGQARMLGGITAALVSLTGATWLSFYLVQQLNQTFLLSLAAGIIGFGVAAWGLWRIAGRTTLPRRSSDPPKRHTTLRKTDLRGAQMEEKLRLFARRQGAILD